MNKASLLILAGGLGSRYKGAKQTASISEQQETLMEFALFDALQVGIRKFIFIINTFFPENLQTRLQHLLESHQAECHFVIQELLTFIPENLQNILQDRTRPLGTAHAVYCSKTIINEPFITINADDFYGRQSFAQGWAAIDSNLIDKQNYALVAFELSKTLSEHGSVSRGICNIKNDLLLGVEEYTNIQKNKEDILGTNKQGKQQILNPGDKVSMNFWILHPSIFEVIETELNHFLINLENNATQELYLPSIIDQSIKQNNISTKVLYITNQWFGLTYPEDKTSVTAAILQEKKEGKYPHYLWQK